FTAEIRSHIPERLSEEIEHMKACCEESAKNMNTTFKFEHSNAYPSFELSKDSLVFKLTEEATRKVGIEPIPMVIGGGSDANIIASHGYQCAIMNMLM
ncbi:MAG: peptidase M20, partial [Peptostreptococcaceae bacterium]